MTPTPYDWDAEGPWEDPSADCEVHPRGGAGFWAITLLTIVIIAVTIVVWAESAGAGDGHHGCIGDPVSLGGDHDNYPSPPDTREDQPCDKTPPTTTSPPTTYPTVPTPSTTVPPATTIAPPSTTSVPVAILTEMVESPAAVPVVGEPALTG